eukprot:m.207340 g.207340  ORF g.207340 m.207340 type:complete len:77 (+) comp13762_c0_seq7:2304-2534(+)
MDGVVGTPTTPHLKEKKKSLGTIDCERKPVVVVHVVTISFVLERIIEQDFEEKFQMERIGSDQYGVERFVHIRAKV